MRSRNVIISLVFVVVLLVYVFLKVQFWEPRKKLTLRRNPSRIEYTQLALCRMDCHHISANDMTDIIKNGEINSASSDLRKRPCPIFTVGGVTKKGMRLSVIIEQCGTVARITNCYNPDETIICHCPEDKNQPISFYKN